MDEESKSEAEANLSSLSDKESTVSAKDLEPEASGVAPSGKKRLGVLKIEGFVLGQAFFEPLPEDELRLWEGEGSASDDYTEGVARDDSGADAVR